MKIGVVGAGAWGKNLVRNLNDMGALCGIVDTSPVLRDSYREQYPNTAIHECLDSFLNTEFDAAIVAVPAPLHYEIAKRLLCAGKDILVEKPLTLTAVESEDLVNIAGENNKLLMVNHLLMYQPAVQWIKNAVNNGIVGKLNRIHQHRLGLGRARSVENVLWSLGVHDVAVILYLTGTTPDNINAYGQWTLRTGIEDDVYLHLEFPGDIQSNLHCSWLWPEKNRGMVIVGSSGMLVYNEIEQKVYMHKKYIDKDLNNVDEGSELVYEGSGEPVKLMLEHFMDCIKTRNTPLSDGVNGLEVVKVLETASKELKL